MACGRCETASACTGTRLGISSSAAPSPLLLAAAIALAMPTFFMLPLWSFWTQWPRLMATLLVLQSRTQLRCLQLQNTPKCADRSMQWNEEKGLEP